MERKTYVQPEVEVLQIEVEKGFAQSNGAGHEPSPVVPWENY